MSLGLAGWRVAGLAAAWCIPTAASDAQTVVRLDKPAATHPAEWTDVVTRLVGFGTTGVYAVHTDDGDLQRLQRFRFPAINGR